MRRRGNPKALMRAVRRNPKMTSSAKRKAISTFAETDTKDALWNRKPKARSRHPKAWN